MQNTNFSTEVQGTGTAQQKFSTTTNDLFTYFGYDYIKEKVDILLFGWISGDAMEYLQPNERVSVLSFYSKLLEHIRTCEKTHEFQKNKYFEIDSYSFFSDIQKTDVKLYFNKTLTAFLESDIANDKTQRYDVIWSVSLLKKYTKKIIKTKENFIQQ